MRGLEILEGVGDESLGQWEEEGRNAYHIRRRLSVEEQKGIGEACDLRGSSEAQERLTKAWRWLMAPLRQMARDEIAGVID